MVAFDEREPCAEVFVVAVTDANNSHNIRSRKCKRLQGQLKARASRRGPRPTALPGRLLSAGAPREFAIKLEAPRGKRDICLRDDHLRPTPHLTTVLAADKAFGRHALAKIMLVASFCRICM